MEQWIQDVFNQIKVTNTTTADKNFFANGIFGSPLIIFFIFVGAFFLIKVSDHIIKKIIAQGKLEKTKGIFIKRILKGGVILLAFFFAALEITPLKSMATTLLASSGILVVVIGFAAQEAMANVVAGAFISIFKPFAIGDYIKIEDKKIDGTVEDISLRHTVIRTFENTRVIVPNSIVNNSVLKNANYHEDKVCNFLDVGISYDTNIDFAKEIIIRKASQHPDFLDNRTLEEKINKLSPIIVRVTELGESSIHLRASIWSKNQFIGFALLSDLRQSIKEEFDKQGIEIPFPHRVVIYKEEKRKEHDIS